MSVANERLRECLNYDCITGIFTWAKTRGAAIKGNIAGSKAKNGYLIIDIDHKKYRAHRLAWQYVYGDVPIEIDHINGIKDDNRIANLRNISHALNCQNVKAARRNNKSGLIGAHFHKSSGKFKPAIRINGKCIRLGSFDSAIDANRAYLQAKAIHHPAFSENK